MWDLKQLLCTNQATPAATPWICMAVGEDNSPFRPGTVRVVICCHTDSAKDVMYCEVVRG
ncbi:Hypothetical protein SMAX5B_005447 [Scophthalmus maximus]|uniref:Uncharacterized protein n=1 Tax=Scophthalmus maximus TaxID=52904 RepID=A0A2U9B205_SCOMX|nr:Hypothetical protein SMAX5B_005447 [Scophthalmus maximus]